jgi:triosephosphate isomerase
MAIRPLVAGNWKMNMLSGPAEALATAVRDGASDLSGIDVAVCPVFTVLPAVRRVLGGDGPVALGAQDCHPAEKGAFTGDVSAEMLADAGCSVVIVGHSERRQGHGEDDAIVRAKAEAAARAGLVAIVCVGETEVEREAGEAERVVERQLRGSIPGGASAATLVVAYEPVWAIGTGRTPTSDDIAAMHRHMRAVVSGIVGGGDDGGAGVRLLYGGSVKPGNAAEILAIADVDGALVGGASLQADDFLAICRAAAGA